jgi:hypothetical protein
LLNSEDGTFCISPALPKLGDLPSARRQSRLPTYMEVKAVVFCRKPNKKVKGSRLPTYMEVKAVIFCSKPEQEG